MGSDHVSMGGLFLSLWNELEGLLDFYSQSNGNSV